MRDHISAFVVAGGRSTRMGQDKAFLQLHGRTLLDCALETAREIAATVRIVGAKEKFGAHGEVIEDIFPGRGPLAGIHAALRSTVTNLNVMLAVDTPFVEPAALEYFIGVAENSYKLVTVPKVGGHFHPLCAVYHRNFADLAERSLSDGKNRIDALFTPEVTRIITEEELQSLAFDAAMFDNLNTPEEFERAQAHRLGRHRPNEH